MRNYTTSDCSGADYTNVHVPVAACQVAAPSSGQRVQPGAVSPIGGSCPFSGTPTAIGGVSAGGIVSTICCVP